jgi:hypothetical protein
MYGGMEVWLHALLTLALYGGGGGQPHAPATLSPLANGQEAG